MILHPPTRDFVELTRDEGGLHRLPALDGLRGLAVLAVVAFHLGLPGMVGGYLGVSTFFTLSGFLITSLLLDELARAGRVDVRRFWGRRARRLLAASLTTVVATVAVFGHLAGTADQRAGLRGDAVSSVLQVANWHFVLSGSSYGRLFAAPSPLLHFWSLAVEEQCYWLLPLVLLGLWRVARGRRALLAVALGALAVVSAALPLLVPMGRDRVYFGTDTRAAELLLGALLAVVLSDRLVRRRLALRFTTRVPVVAVGSVALAVQVWWWWHLDQTTGWLYRGGFALYAVLTCVVLVAATVPSGPLHAVLRSGALRRVGDRSFGLYLVHWPVFLLVRQGAPGLATPVRVALQLGLAAVVTEGMYRWVERPVRQGRWPGPGRGGPVAAVAVVAALVVALLPVPADRSLRTLDFEQSTRAFDALAGRAPATTATTTPTVTATTPAPAVTVPRTEVFGDSTGLLLGLGLDLASRGGRDAVHVVGGSADIGCGVSRFTRIRAVYDAPPMPKCLRWPARWSAEVGRQRPEMALLVTGTWEVPDAVLPGTAGFSDVTRPDGAAFVKAEMLRAVDVLAARGALVVLVTWPTFASWAADGRSAAVHRQHEPRRMAQFHQIEREVAAARPRSVRVVDLADWFARRGLRDDRRLRPDGIHLTAPAVVEVAPQWLLPELRRTWADWRRTDPSSAPG